MVVVAGTVVVVTGSAVVVTSSAESPSDPQALIASAMTATRYQVRLRIRVGVMVLPFLWC